MPEHDFHPDCETLQRLVDGELDASAVRRFVQLADDDPESWKTIAMSYIEDQQFRRSFENFDAVSEPDSHLQVRTSPTTLQANSRPGALRLLATAAGIAAAMTIGFILGDRSDAPQNPHRNVLAATAPESIPNDNPVMPADFEPEYRMELMTEDGQPVGSEVDLYRMKDFKRLLASQGADDRFSLQQMLPESGFTDDARARLSRSGYLLDQDTRYVSGRLDDGRAFVVPLRSIRLNTSH